MKSKGQIAYEQDVERRPMYPGNLGPRPTWDNLSEIAKWSWERGERCIGGKYD